MSEAGLPLWTCVYLTCVVCGREWLTKGRGEPYRCPDCTRVAMSSSEEPEPDPCHERDFAPSPPSDR